MTLLLPSAAGPGPAARTSSFWSENSRRGAHAAAGPHPRRRLARAGAGWRAAPAGWRGDSIGVAPSAGNVSQREPPHAPPTFRRMKKGSAPADPHKCKPSPKIGPIHRCLMAALERQSVHGASVDASAALDAVVGSDNVALLVDLENSTDRASVCASATTDARILINLDSHNGTSVYLPPHEGPLVTFRAVRPLSPERPHRDESTIRRRTKTATLDFGYVSKREAISAASGACDATDGHDPPRATANGEKSVIPAALQSQSVTEISPSPPCRAGGYSRGAEILPISVSGFQIRTPWRKPA